MAASRKRHEPSRSLLREHSLGLTVAGILAAWFVLYTRADPSTHLGAFYGNATADWLGTLVFVIATKYLYEIGSAESRTPHPRSRSAALRFVIDHSLTIGLVVTGALWAALYRRLDVDSKAGEVIGNVVSEWTQLIGIVLITKYARESRSKESR